MELREIKQIIAEILSDINKNQWNLTFRKYDPFFERLGMRSRRKFDILAKFDYQLRRNNITLWSGKEPVKKLEDFPKGETITFRLKEVSQQKRTDEITESSLKVPVKYAGTVYIEDAESGIELYKHQEEAFLNLQKEIIESNKNPFAGLLVLPTGGGKTLTAAYWIAKNILDKNKKVLWLAHRHELLEQAQRTFAEKLAFGDIFKNKKSFNYRLISGIHDKPVNIKPTDDLIISSKDSLNAGFNHLYKNWIENKIDEIFLVIDEAHHATAKTYRKFIANIKNHVSQFKMLGLTATPFRTDEDEKGLLKKVFPDDIIYKIDLRTLIRLGILSEPHFEEVATKQNIIDQYGLSEKQIKQIKLKFGDFNSILGDDISYSIATNKERNKIIVDHYKNEKLKYKQTIVFAINVSNAIALNALFRKAGIKSDYVLSSIKDLATGVTISSEDNKKKIGQFRSGKLEVLINVNILTEGTDVPNVQSVFLTRPTISTISMTQMIGRGLRGPRAGGTKDAYIVSFIDDWQNKISWVNPEKLFIEENVDFNDREVETTKQLIRLVAINKVEEFAILSNQIIDPQTREELEKLNFIERFPIGIYQFKFLKVIDGKEPEDKNCEVLVYDNIRQSYSDFINGLSAFFKRNNLSDKDVLSDDELDQYANIVEDEFFDGCLKYPAYRIEDIKDILQYYAIQSQIPPFVELKDREKYDIDKIAKEIIEKDMGERAQVEMINKTWESNEVAWQTFFNFDQKAFLREIGLSKDKFSHPELYMRKPIIPRDEKERQFLEKLSLYDIREHNPEYAKWLSDEVYKKFTDDDGFYYCASSGYRSKNKLDFQIDHIKPMSNGGLTVLENLQLLTRRENAKKGNFDPSQVT
jgi:superfamily II DNA or RNA helicase